MLIVVVVGAMKRILALTLLILWLPAWADSIGSARTPLAQKNVSFFGDSISHGAFAIDSRKNLWVRVLQARIGPSGGYGFVPLTSVGDGDKLTTDIASLRWAGEWVTNPADSISSSASPSGYSTRSQSKGAGISITIPKDYPVAQIHWIQSPIGGQLRVYADGKVVGEVETNGPLEWKSKQFSLGASSGPTRTIYLEAMDVSPVDLVGLEYLGYRIGPVVNNYSQSGRALVNVSLNTINQVVAESSVLIMALGHNDQKHADSDDQYFERFRQRISWLITSAKANDVRVVVPDFCWTTPESSRTRQELRRLAVETGGTYIDLPSRISAEDHPVTSDYLINQLGMWWDPSHPNIKGHRWIADEVYSSGKFDELIGNSSKHTFEQQMKSAVMMR